MTIQITSRYDFIYWALSGFLILYPSILISCLRPKKTHFFLRIAVFTTASTALIIGLQSMGYVYFGNTLLYHFIQLLAFLIFPFCNEGTIREYVYYKIWAYAFSGLMSQLPGLMVSLTSFGQPFKITILSKLAAAAVTTVLICVTFLILNRKEIESQGWREMLLAGMIALSMNMLNGLIFRSQTEGTKAELTYQIFLLQALSSICAILAMLILAEINYRKRLEGDRAIRERILALERKHFEERQQEIDLINRKCHDLKHQIAALERIHDEQKYRDNIDELKSAVMMYDDSLQTGNLALETILMEKKLQYKEQGVTLNCVVDGLSIEFVDTVDLYILLGNILDNALENVIRYEEPEKRSVEIRIFRDRNMIRMIFRNYLERVPEFRNGLPLTTKPTDGNHGYGYQSIRQIVKKYHGEMTIDTDDHLFELKIMLPLPLSH